MDEEKGLNTKNQQTSKGSPALAAGRIGPLRGLLPRGRILARLAAAALALIAFVVLVRALPISAWLESVRHWIDSLGFWGPAAFVAVYVVAVLLFFPGSLLTLVAGALYGLVEGTLIVSLAATTAAALAFLIARYFARDKVRRLVEQSPRLAAVDEAIGAEGWKIVALLRLSPAVPFTLQNYLYGVTAIRFWPCILITWVAMLPGTFLYVYIGSLGKTAAEAAETSAAEWTIRGVGLIATIVVTIYIARLARRAIERQMRIEP